MKSKLPLLDWISPDWPAPDNVHAITTTREGGFSAGPWSGLNLGLHCGDKPRHVHRNRELLEKILPSEPQWLRQVHGARVIKHSGLPGNEPEADAITSFYPGQVCSVLTADCLSVFFCDRAGDRVAVAHAGWRGLAAGILQETVRALGGMPEDLMAWLGPAIGPNAYEVGVELASSFPDEFPEGFTRHRDRFRLDLYSIARMKLQRAGVCRVFGGELCTFSDRERFYSYRRDGVTGRMASLIWLTPEDQQRSAGDVGGATMP